MPQVSASAPDPARLVADVDAGSGSSSPGPMLVIDHRLYFAAGDEFDASAGRTGRELWTSDGTASGTVLVKDIYPGTHQEHGNTYPNGSAPNYLTNLNGTLFFTAVDADHGNELWKSDGTSAGTVMVADLAPGAASSSPRSLTVSGGSLYFTATDGTGEVDLWKTDGSSTGTVAIKPLRSTYTSLASVAGEVFFAINDQTAGYELWKTDGTAAGTVLVKDINPGGPFYAESADELTAANGKLFFEARDPAHGVELWTSDGTSAGTAMVKDIQPGPYNSTPRYLTAFAGQLYFSAYDGGDGDELWRTDGTASGTVMVKDANPGGGSPHGYYLANSGNPEKLTVSNGELFFTAFEPTAGRELWKSDGTSSGTTQVADINPGSADGVSRSTELVSSGGALFLRADDGLHGLELWQSQGTPASTFMVKDIRPGSANSYAGSLTPGDGTVYFTANDGIHGYELWNAVVSNPPPDTTAPDTTITSGPADGSTIATNAATFEFSGTSGDTVGFQCQLDGGAFVDCGSPFTFLGLGNGAHAVAVRAVDGSGNVDPTPAQRTFTVSAVVVPPPPLPPHDAPVAPSNAFHLPSHGKANTTKATLAVSVTLPGPGILALKPARRSPVKRARVAVTRAGKATLVIKLSPKGLRELRRSRTGRMRVSVALTFTPVGGVPKTEVKHYTLIMKQR